MKVLLLKLMKGFYILIVNVQPLLQREDDEDARQWDIIIDFIALAMWQNYVQM